MDNRLIVSLKTVLLDTNLDNALKAEILTITSELEIADIINKNINPEKIHKIREFLVKSISKELEIDFENIYNKLNIIHDYRFKSKDI
ncbi:aminopeptidase N C-terminal domain-containing protein [bacterium]|nr:aminopeptidase N C-terminal domain-containing protein [bacterium]